jgi:hypothetical protein
MTFNTWKRIRTQSLGGVCLKVFPYEYLKIPAIFAIPLDNSNKPGCFQANSTQAHIFSLGVS